MQAKSKGPKSRSSFEISLALEKLRPLEGKACFLQSAHSFFVSSFLFPLQKKTAAPVARAAKIFSLHDRRGTPERPYVFAFSFCFRQFRYCSAFAAAGGLCFLQIFANDHLTLSTLSSPFALH